MDSGERIKQQFSLVSRKRMTKLIERNHSNNKKVYTDGSKSTERKVGFAAVLADIIREEHY